MPHKKYKLKNQLILLLVCILSTGNISAQQFTPFVVSSSGGFYNNSSGMLSFTTGEMSAVETYISPSAILTQGFQQTDVLGTYVVENPIPNFSFHIYPNPSNGDFNLVTDSESNEHLTVTILDILGRDVLNTTFYHEGKINIHSFDLPDAESGIYLIRLTVEGTNSSSRAYHFIEKIQITRNK